MNQLYKGLLGFISVVLFTSCLGESGNMLRFSSRLAVVQEEPFKSLFVRDDSIPEGYLISSPALEGREELKEGDCCLVEYRLDYEAEQDRGVYPVEILSCDTIRTSPLLPVLTDTTRILDNEQFVTLSFDKSLYLKGRYFLQVQVKEHQETRQDLFDFSYDPDQSLMVGEDNVRVYHLYFRSYKDQALDTIRSSSLTLQNAFVMDDFVAKAGQTELENGVDSLCFVINYPRSFNTDTTGLIWTVTDTFAIRLKQAAL